VSGALDGGSKHTGSNGDNPGQGQGGATPGGQQPGTGSNAGSGNGTSPGVANDAGPNTLPAERACNTAGNPGPRALRRLSAAEFAASIADLFGDKATPVAPVFNDLRVLGFTVDSHELQVKDLNADQLMTNAEAVAAWAVGAGNKLDQLKQLAGGCSSHDAACGKAFVKAFGRKAFRTAMPDDDNDPRIKGYTDLFMAEADFTSGVSTVISAMLQSPYFLYRSELGPVGATGDTFLTPYEVAGSLSYLLTGTAPDETLLKAAGAVGNADDKTLTKLIDEQAARLLGTGTLTPAAQGALMNFMSGWLGLDRLYTNVKSDKVQTLTAEQRADMAMETQQFILNIWGAQTGNTVGDLFSANYTFLNQNLANYYKVSPAGLSSSFSQVELPAPRENGILAQASILLGYSRSDGSSPTQRGHLVRSRLLCQNVPPPPGDIDTTFVPNSQFKTTREQYLKSHAAPGHQPCYSCHQAMDLIGVAFEHYDAFGNYRPTENNVTVDATGTIYSPTATGGDPVNVDGLSGPNGLHAFLAQSEDVKSCFARYWAYYAFGSASWDQDKCTHDAIRKEAKSNSYSLKSVLMAILHSPRFIKRVKDQ